MNEANHPVGHFVFSLDTELAWGGLWDQPHLQHATRDGAAERETIRRLLDLMEEFGIVATWAITGHLFYEKCEECTVCPILALQGQDVRFDQIWATQHPMWYGADIIEMLIATDAGHEICFHGYTHRLFGKLSTEEASREISEWRRLGIRRGLVPQTVIFPQGSLGHLDLFREAGFICYRGKEVRHPVLAMPVFGKVLNQINLRLSLLPPQVFEAKVDALGLVNIPSSQWLFRTNRRIETVLDALNLPTLRLQPAACSIKKAAEQKKVIHLWVHPHEFRTEKDFRKLRFVFERFAEQAQAGRLKSITMADLARRTLQQSSSNSGMSGRLAGARETAETTADSNGAKV